MENVETMSCLQISTNFPQRALQSILPSIWIKKREKPLFHHHLSHGLTSLPLSPPPLASLCTTFLFLCPFSPCQRLPAHTQHTLHTPQTKKPTTAGAGDHNL